MFQGILSRGTVYMALNVVSAVAIVVVNKTILTTLQFHFTVALTLLHTIATMAGDSPSNTSLAVGVFCVKS